MQEIIILLFAERDEFIDLIGQDLQGRSPEILIGKIDPGHLGSTFDGRRSCRLKQFLIQRNE